MNLTQRYYIDKDKITHRVVDSEVVILNLESGNYYTINETGAIIWKALDDKKCLSEILDLLKNEYQCAEEKDFEKDMEGLISFLEKENIIEKI